MSKTTVNAVLLSDDPVQCFPTRVLQNQGFCERKPGVLPVTGKNLKIIAEIVEKQCANG